MFKKGSEPEHRVSLVKRTAFVLVAITLFFALAEIAARGLLKFYFNYKYRDILEYYNHPIAETFGEDLQYHELYHWLWKGGTRFRRGMVDPGKKPGLYRIITLGDSCTWGVLVEQDQTYSALLEKKLNEYYRGYAQIQVLNGGVLGFSSLQMLRYLTHDLERFAPDMVIARGNWDDSPLGDDPYMVRTERSMEGIKAILAQSKLYYLIKFMTLQGKSRIFSKKKPDPKGAEKTNFHLMAELGEKRGFDLMIVEYHFKEKDGVVRVDKINTNALWPAPFVFVHDAYLQSGMTPDEFLLDEVHPSAAGHELIAERIFQNIISLKTIEKRMGFDEKTAFPETEKPQQ